jgi:hypothetical protein
MKYIYLIITTILIIGNLPGKSTTNNEKCKILFRLKKIKEPIHIKDLKTIDLQITNNEDSPVFVPEFLNLGESFNDQETDLILFIKRKETLFSKYNIVTQYVEFSLIEKNRNYLTIPPNKTFEKEQDIQIMDSFKYAGKYMLQAQVRLKNADDVIVLESNWIRFKIIE